MKAVSARGATLLSERSLRRAFARPLEAQVSPSSCLSCSSAVEVQRITSAAWESHTGKTARPRAAAVVSSRQRLSGGVLGSEPPARLPPPSHASTGCLVVQGVACS